MSTTIPSDTMLKDTTGQEGFPFCGDLDIRIAADGTWFHEGTPIGRLELVKLFSTVLKRDEQGDFWLRTPVERARITVEDAPWMAIEVLSDGSPDDPALSLRLNTEKIIPLDGEHGLRVATTPGTNEPAPYIKVMDGDGDFPLEARLNRPVFYELVDLGVERIIDGKPHLVIRSRGEEFSLGQLEAT